MQFARHAQPAQLRPVAGGVGVDRDPRVGAGRHRPGEVLGVDVALVAQRQPGVPQRLVEVVDPRPGQRGGAAPGRVVGEADAIEALRNSERHRAIRPQIPWHLGFTLALEPLLLIDGVSGELADGLWDEGLKTPDAVFAETDADLLAIRGLGAARLRRIREEQARRYSAPRPPAKRGSRPP